MNAVYKTISLLIHAVPQPLNKSLRAGRWGNHKANTQWDYVVAVAVARQKPKTPIQRAKLSIIRHSYRTLDYDGLVGSMKPVVDGLVSAGVLVDDSWKVLGKWDVDQKFRPKKDGPLLEILIEELPVD